MIRRTVPLPPKRQRPRSGIERGPQRVWLRHRRFVKSLCCCVCNAPFVDFAHIRSAADSGTGLKPPDWRGVPLCRNHHREQHEAGQGTFEDRYHIDLDALAAQLVAKSPDAKMRLAMMEQGLWPPNGDGPSPAAPKPIPPAPWRLSGSRTTVIPILGVANRPATAPVPSHPDTGAEHR